MRFFKARTENKVELMSDKDKTKDGRGPSVPTRNWDPEGDV